MALESYTYVSPIGLLQFDCNNHAIVSIRFSDHETNTIGFNEELKDKIKTQFDDYFSGQLYQFNLPLTPAGTDFQKKVWQQLKKIEYGQQVSYADLASALGNKKLIRAVGGANSKNPLPIVIPCHRVIGSNNKLVGYAGGLWRKKWLLRHELEFTPKKYKLF